MTRPVGKGRQLQALAATRTPDPPDVPTTAEVGLPDLVIYGYNAILAPAATPRPTIDKLNATVIKCSPMPTPSPVAARWSCASEAARRSSSSRPWTR
jgi:tripartite-type tricarboxylate transporter receptor subunit TctC